MSIKATVPALTAVEQPYKLFSNLHNSQFPSHSQYCLEVIFLLTLPNVANLPLVWGLILTIHIDNNYCLLFCNFLCYISKKAIRLIKLNAADGRKLVKKGILPAFARPHPSFSAFSPPPNATPISLKKGYIDT